MSWMRRNREWRAYHRENAVEELRGSAAFGGNATVAARLVMLL
jgi:hypothetical protein